MGETETHSDRASGFSSDTLFASMGLGSVAGAIAGLVWGGIGGRIAMRVLFLTSDEGLKGAISDDGFEIGVISAATIFLLIATTILGSFAGAVFGAVRAFVAAPTTILLPTFGVAAAATGGSMIVHADGIDFRLLEPLALTVGFFILIPGLWGVTVVLLTSRLRTRFLPSPDELGTRIGGVIGQLAAWAFLAALTITGVLGLIRDVRALT